MKYTFKILIVLSIVLLVATAAYAFESYFEIIQLEDKLIRLHILANSDTVQDQELKLKVRNNILIEFNSKFANVTNKNDSEELIVKNLTEIKEIAEQTIEEEGYYYDVKVFYGNYEFDAREYGDFTLPSGDYDSVRIEIGEAEGQNWWCVMFPPMCFTEFGRDTLETAFSLDLEEKLSAVLTEEEIRMIETNRGYSDIKLKSKFAEIVRDFLK